MKIWTVILALFLCFGFPAFAGNDSIVDQDLSDLVQKIDEKTETITTIRAQFTQRKELYITTKPVELHGTFFLKKPDGIKFSAVPEDDLILVITEEEVVSLSPRVKKATRIKLNKRRDFLTQHLLSKKLETMLGFFTITKWRQPDQAGNHQLILTPIKRKFKKKFKKIHFWVNPDYLIFKVHVYEKGGDVNRLELTDIEVNVAIDSSEFATTIPDDYQMDNRLAFIFGSDFGF